MVGDAVCMRSMRVPRRSCNLPALGAHKFGLVFVVQILCGQRNLVINLDHRMGWCGLGLDIGALQGLMFVKTQEQQLRGANAVRVCVQRTCTNTRPIGCVGVVFNLE